MNSGLDRSHSVSNVLSRYNNIVISRVSEAACWRHTARRWWGINGGVGAQEQRVSNYDRNACARSSAGPPFCRANMTSENPLQHSGRNGQPPVGESITVHNRPEAIIGTISYYYYYRQKTKRRIMIATNDDDDDDDNII